MTDPTPITGTAPTPIPFGDPPAAPVHVEADPATVPATDGATPVDAGPAPDIRIAFDLSIVGSAGGSPTVWADYLRAYLGHVTNVWIDREDLADVFDAFGGQAAAKEARESFFTVSNVQIPSNLTGDPALIALQMRADIAAVLKRRANLQ